MDPKSEMPAYVYREMAQQARRMAEATSLAEEQSRLNHYANHLDWLAAQAEEKPTEVGS